MIQTRIGKGKKSDPPNRTKLFAKLVMEGFLNDDACGGVLPLTEEKQFWERKDLVARLVLMQMVQENTFLQIV